MITGPLIKLLKKENLALIPRIVWIVMFVSKLLIILAVYYLYYIYAPAKKLIKIDSDLQNLFFALGGGVALLSFFLHFFMASDGMLKKFLQRANPQKFLENRDSLKRQEVQEVFSKISINEQKIYVFIHSLFPLLLIPLVLNEIVAIFGFLMAYTSSNPELMFPYMAAALFLDFSAFPKKPDALARNAYRWIH